MSVYDQRVRMAVQKGLALVDECAMEVDEYMLETVIYDLFGRMVREKCVPGDFTIGWAVEMLSAKPELMKVRIDVTGSDPQNMKELLVAALAELVTVDALREVEPYAREVGFLPESEWRRGRRI